MSSKNFKKPARSGGYDNYSIRSATLVENYFPGPQRRNLIMDPDRAIGKYDPGTFAVDELMMNGPGSLLQALPDASKYSNGRVFETPRMNPYKNFGIDDRNIASYQVEQLHNNPLSQYTTKPDNEIPKFDCMSQPDNYSNMVNRREEEYKDFFENTNQYGEQNLQYAQNVYQQYSGETVNPNASVVYNMSLNTKEETNPMIAMGSSNKAINMPDFSGLCYSGVFQPSRQIGQEGGPNPPRVYNNNVARPRTISDTGFMNKNVGGEVCVPDPSLNFSNQLVLNKFN